MSLDREQINRMEQKLLREGNAFKPELRLCTPAKGERFVMKDCACMHPVLRLCLGRRNQRREVEIYERLQGLEGIPDLHGVIDLNAFAIAYVEGRPLIRKLGRDRLERALKSLELVILGIHGRKVVHLDLKQKRNVLVREDDTVAVVDFQSAFSFHKGLLAPLFFRMLKGQDLAGLIKFKGKYLPDLLTPQEQRLFRRYLLFSKLWPFTYLFRFLRKIFNNGTN
jgi:hypothetical protein